MANRPNTDEEETMPMYIPKIREEPLPVPTHDHPWPELDPRRIAPDGIATPRTTTERLPAFLSFVLVIAMIFMAGCKRRGGPHMSESQMDEIERQIPGASCVESADYGFADCAVGTVFQRCRLIKDQAACRPVVVSR